MNRWKLTGDITLVFILGGLVGSVGAGFYFKHQHLRFLDHKARKAFFMEKLSEGLTLTQDQKAKIGAIVEQMEERQQQYSLQKQVEINKLIDQMKRGLNGDQQKRLDLMRERFERRRKATETMQHPLLKDYGLD